MSPRNRREFQGANFYDVPGGESVVSVTTVLDGAWPNNGWRIPFGAKHVAERAVFQFSELARRLDSEDPVDWTLKWLKAAPTELRDAAGEHGTDVHAYLEARLRGQLAARPVTPAEQAVEAFLDGYRPDPIYIETQVRSVAEGYAGSLDAIVDIYGRRTLLDLKTSGLYDPLAKNKTKAGGDHKDRLQLAAYRYADLIFEDGRDIAPVPNIDSAVILAIPRDHPQAWRPIEVEAGPLEHRRFLDLLRAWKWHHEIKDTPMGEHLLPQAEVA